MKKSNQFSLFQGICNENSFSLSLFLVTCASTNKKNSELDSNSVLTPDEVDLVLDGIDRDLINPNSARFGNLNYFEYYKLKKLLNKKYSIDKMKTESNTLANYFTSSDLKDFEKKSDVTHKVLSRLISEAERKKENADIGKKITIPTGNFLIFTSLVGVAVLAGNPHAYGLVATKNFLGFQIGKSVNLTVISQLAGVGIFGWILTSLGEGKYDVVSDKCGQVISYGQRVDKFFEDPFWKSNSEIKNVNFPRMEGELKALWESITSKYDSCYAS